MKRRLHYIDPRSIALMCVISLVCFCIGEGVTRWAIFGTKGLSYEAMRTTRHIGRSGLLQPSAHEEIVYELRPGVDAPFKFHPFRTNNDGLRDNEYPKQKPAGMFRVAVVGDSFTMGEGVAIEETYHSLLETWLNSGSNPVKFEFTNFGVSGYSLVQYVSTIRYKVSQYKPDLVLIGFCAANDSEPPNFAAFHTRYKVLPEGNGFFRSYLFARIGDVYKRYYDSIRSFKPGDDADEPYVDEQFRALASLSRELQTPLMIAYIDNKGASHDFPLIQSKARQYGFDLIDATDGFAPEISLRHIIYLTDKHPNAAANRIIATSLFRELRKRTPFRDVVLSDREERSAAPR